MKDYLRNIGYFLISVLCACSSPEGNVSHVITIDPDQSGIAKLSEHFESIDYILLDYPDSLPIVNAYAMVFTEDNILVESKETAAVFIFDRRGKLQRVIRNYGEGPGEYVYIDEMFVRDHRIVLHARPWKQLTFDFEGNLLEEVKLPSGSKRAYLAQDFNLYYHQQGEDGYQWTFQRFSGKEVQGYLPLKEGHETFITRGDPWGFRYDSNRNQIYMIEANTYNVQVFDESGYWKDSISFDFGRYSFDSKKRLALASDHQEKRAYLQDNPKVNDLSTFNGFTNFLVLTFNLMGQGNHAVFLNDDYKIVAQVKEWENDFDGMKVYNHHWAFTQDEIIYQLNSRKFYTDYVETFQGKKVKQESVHDFFDQNRENLKEEKLVLVVLKVK